SCSLGSSRVLLGSQGQVGLAFGAASIGLVVTPMSGLTPGGALPTVNAGNTAPEPSGSLLDAGAAMGGKAPLRARLAASGEATRPPMNSPSDIPLSRA